MLTHHQLPELPDPNFGEVGQQSRLKHLPGVRLRGLRVVLPERKYDANRGAQRPEQAARGALAESLFNSSRSVPPRFLDDLK